jgi:hypothetical protein
MHWVPSCGLVFRPAASYYRDAHQFGKESLVPDFEHMSRALM